MLSLFLISIFYIKEVSMKPGLSIRTEACQIRLDEFTSVKELPRDMCVQYHTSSVNLPYWFWWPGLRSFLFKIQKWKCSCQQSCTKKTSISNTKNVAEIITSHIMSKSMKSCMIEFHEIKMQRVETFSAQWTQERTEDNCFISMFDRQALERNLAIIPPWQHERIKTKKEFLFEAQSDKKQGASYGYMSNWSEKYKNTNIESYSDKPSMHDEKVFHYLRKGI